MPPAKKFSREDIIEAGCEIVNKEGIEALNARRVAKELNSSVQPIFHNFESMEELKDAVINKMYDVYKQYIADAMGKEKEYKQTGLAYIRFAKDYPEFFKIIFMEKYHSKAENFIVNDSAGKDVIESGRKLTGFTYEEQINFHKTVFIFTHGIASLVASGTVDFTEDEIGELLENTVACMLGKRKFGGSVLEETAKSGKKDRKSRKNKKKEKEGMKKDEKHN